MASNWRNATLQEIADDGEHGFVDGPFGSNLPASCYVETGIPVIRGSNLSLGLQRFDDTEFVFVSDDTAERLSRSCCRPFDIVFTKKGTIGQTGLVPAQGKYERYLLSSNQMKLSVNRSVADPLFVYYYVSSPASRAKILRDSEATGVPKTNLTYLRTFPITLPSLPKQKAIARILGTLDDKIELNRRMNETLEGMARAIFKSWFVDFDPVRAKMDGRQPPGMVAETAALFPDAFEESELGQIPKGWGVASLAESIEIKHGFAFKGEYFQTEPTGDILLTPRNFTIGGGFKGDKFKYYDGPVPNDYVLEAGDLLVTMTDLSKAGDTLGYPAFVPPSHGPRFLHNQRLGKVRVTDPVGENFIYCTLCLPSYRHHVLATASGSTVKHTSPDRIRGFEYVRADSRAVDLFERLVGPMRNRIDANDAEIRSLSALRDTLVPKLLSGQIDLCVRKSSS